MNDDYLWDGSGDAPADVARLEEVLRPLAHGAARATALPPRRPLAVAAALLLAAVAGAAAWQVGRMATERSRPSFRVAHLDGPPNAKFARPAEEARLGVGSWVETPDGGFAQVEVADIGHVVVWPESRVGLVATGEGRHELAIAHGRLEATVTARPRLFFIRTPSALVIDLGCAYTLETDEQGNGHLQVTSGAVAVPIDGREALVPAGARCTLHAGRGPGTPVFVDAPRELRTAVDAFDSTGDEEAVLAVLGSVRAPDTLTLWHLLPAVEGDARATLVSAIVSHVPLPDGVRRADVLAVREDALTAWYEEIEWEW